jgi:hypothetical protein
MDSHSYDMLDNYWAIFASFRYYGVPAYKTDTLSDSNYWSDVSMWALADSCYRVWWHCLERAVHIHGKPLPSAASVLIKTPSDVDVCKERTMMRCLARCRNVTWNLCKLFKRWRNVERIIVRLPFTNRGHASIRSELMFWNSSNVIL